MNRPDLDRLADLARCDDWHTQIVGSDLRVLVAYARELEATLANERGTGPTPDGWYWADGQWNREAGGGIYTVDRNPCPTDDDINCDCQWLPTTWTARFLRWDDEEYKNVVTIGTYDTAREAIRAASVPA